MLFWNNGKQFTIKDSTNKIIEKEVRFCQTIGVPTLRYKINNTIFSAFYYQQIGKDVNNLTVSAFDANFQIAQIIKINETKNTQLKITLGAEIVSGTAIEKIGKENILKLTDLRKKYDECF